MTGTDDDRRDRAVEMRDLPLGVAEAGTARAMNVFGLRGKVPSGIQRDEPGVSHRPHGGEQTGLIEGLVQIIKQTEQVAGGNRIKRLADVIVSGDAPDLEQGTGVVTPARLLHVLLETQERRALSEEDGKRRQGDIGHGIARVVARAPIRESGRDVAPASDEMIESARIHAPSNAGTDPKVQVTIV